MAAAKNTLKSSSRQGKCQRINKQWKSFPDYMNAITFKSLAGKCEANRGNEWAMPDAFVVVYYHI